MHIHQKFCQRLDWNLLKIFHEIVKANGVTSAANVLWRKQSTISLALKRLEKSLGKTLCRRGPAGFELTDEGRVVYEYARRLYAKIEEIPNSLDDISLELRGSLRIRAISNFVSPKLDELLIAYNQRCPQVEIEVNVATWATISLAILRNEADIGIAPIHVRYPELRYDFLTREAHLVYCGRRHRLFGKAVKTIADLSSEPLVLTGDDEPESLTYFRLKHGLGRCVAATTPNLEEAKRLAVLGVGICMLPEQMAVADVDNGLLWPLTPRMPESCCDIYVITNTHAPKRLVKEFFMEEVARRRGPQPDGGRPPQLEDGERTATSTKRSAEATF